MKLDLLAVLLGKEKIPDGWSSILPDTISLAVPNAAFRYKINSKYWFNLRRVIAKFPQLTVAGDVLALELMNNDRSVIQSQSAQGTALQLFAQPGETTAAGAVVKTGKNKDDTLDAWYAPGNIISINFKGYTPAGGLVVKIAAVGRYYNIPPDMVKK